jgi:hypothetical protein
VLGCPAGLPIYVNGQLIMNLWRYCNYHGPSMCSALCGMQTMDVERTRTLDTCFVYCVSFSSKVPEIIIHTCGHFTFSSKTSWTTFQETNFKFLYKHFSHMQISTLIKEPQQSTTYGVDSCAGLIESSTTVGQFGFSSFRICSWSVQNLCTLPVAHILIILST